MSTAFTKPPIPPYAPVTMLHAGPVSLLFSNGDLRKLRVGGVEIVQRIYVAVRDKDWGTVPVVLHDLVIDDHGDHFRVTFKAINRQNEIAFTWLGEIVGDQDGTIHFTMDGRAETTLQRNRIGFCVLHPASAAGSRATLTHSDGTQSASEFPTLISPHQPFMDLKAISHEFAPGLKAEVSFEGDIFESEDQRNWTDASYKTYSTPLSIPYPVTIQAGTVIRQEVTVRVHGKAPEKSGTTEPATKVSVESTAIGKLPTLGLGAATHGNPLTTRELEYLSALKLSHLRVDLDLSQPDFSSKLGHATSEAASLGLSLEIALFVGSETEQELSALQRAFEGTSSDAKPRVARWLLFTRDEDVTPAKLVVAARPILNNLAPNAPIGGGTNLYFVHINRIHPPVDVLDFVAYSINPQVHAFDMASLVENMTAQPSTVVSTRAICGDLPVVISPITLRARFNADAIGPQAPTPPGKLPDAVDPRQPTGFAATWTLGSLSNLAQAGVNSLTYFETTGWRGVLECEQGAAVPDKFPSQPGAPFPVYYLLAAIAPYAAGEVLPTHISEPLNIAALSLIDGNRRCTIIGNLRDTPQRVAIEGLSGSITLETLGDPTGNIYFEQKQSPLLVDIAPYELVAFHSLTI